MKSESDTDDDDGRE